MKETYPILEDDQMMTAAEAIAATSSNTSSLQQDRVAITAGVPQTLEEALSDIEEGEREFERGETFSHREVMQMVWDKIGRYAG